MSAFDYFISVTGDCSSTGSGRVILTYNGGNPPYTSEWITPDLGLGDEKSGLAAGDYLVRAIDSTYPVNQEFYINVFVSSGSCISETAFTNTTCGNNNGTISVTASTQSQVNDFYLYDSSDNYVTSGVGENNIITFSNLSAGTYYAVAQDIGGCSAHTESIIIESSTNFDFGFYVVNDPQCDGNGGRLIVTGCTGAAPLTYAWSNGFTGSANTGLTAGNYTCTITDANGCVVSKTETVLPVNPVGLGYWSAVTTPSCFAADGELALIITGGTGPYYYSGSNGTTLITYSQVFYLSNITAGSYAVTVTDSALCDFTTTTSISQEGAFDSVTINTRNSACSESDGQIAITLFGGYIPYVYTLVYPDSSTQNITSNSASYTFGDLTSGDYTVIITNDSGCVYTQDVTIIAENVYDLTTSVTASTCTSSNGTVSVEKSSGGFPPFTYTLGDLAYQNTSLSAVTFTNVPVGQHTLSVSDSSGCTVTKQITVQQGPILNFSLYSTSCGSGDSGTITALISDGVPPFTYTWSNNVSGNPQQITVSGLSAGTYSLTIEDSSGCTQTRNVQISCCATYTSFESYEMANQSFQVQSPTKRGLIQMLNEGFDDIASGNTNCRLVSAEFIGTLSVQPSGYTASTSFYTGTTLVDVPSDNLWYDAIEDLLLSVNQIIEVDIDPLTNRLTFKLAPGDTSLTGQEFIISLKINYELSCES
jgi:uncharacterized protein (DUF2141 family)